MKEELIIPKEELDKYYYEDFLSSEEIGQIYGKSKDWAKKYLKDHGYSRTKEEIKKCIEMSRIRKGQKEVLPLTKEELYQEYIVNHKSTNVIADEFNINANVVKKYVRNWGFQKTKEQMLFDRENYTLKDAKERLALKKEQERQEKEAKKVINLQIGTQKRLEYLNRQTEQKKEKLRQQKDLLEYLFYEEKVAIDKIAKKLNTTVKILKAVLEEFNMFRTEEEIQDIILLNKEKKGSYTPIPVSDEELIKMYLNEGLIIKEIAERLSCKEQAIKHRLEVLKVDKSEEQKKEDLRRYNISTFGVEFPTQSLEIKQKSKETSLKNYGTEFPMQCQSLRDKVAQTNISKYGVDNPFKNAEIQKKAHDTIKENHGGFLASYYAMPDKAKEVLSSKEKLQEYISSCEIVNCDYIADSLKIAPSTVYTYMKKYDLMSLIDTRVSSIEQMVKDFLRSIGVTAKKDRTILEGKELDLYCEEQKIAIEVNGTYWHSSCAGTEKMYHFDKSKACEEKGIRLIHIWEYEWENPEIREKIKSMLKIAFGKVDSRIYARKCEIREIPNSTAKLFNDKNHLQGHRNAQITYGLYYQDTLVQLMSFSYDQKKDWWEIIRGCPASNNIVVGGVSKLFYHFIKTNNPEKVFSYCDFNKFDGTGYEALGMKFIGYTEPDMLWLMPNGEVVSRSPSKHKFYKENAKGKIYRAGSKRYLWTKNK